MRGPCVYHVGELELVMLVAGHDRLVLCMLVLVGSGFSLHLVISRCMMG